jgi:hypothetical protein
VAVLTLAAAQRSGCAQVAEATAGELLLVAIAELRRMQRACWWGRIACRARALPVGCLRQGMGL